MLLTACKDKFGVAAMLNIGSQQRFYITFLIGCNLLKLVNRQNAGFGRVLNIKKDFFQRYLRILNIAQTQVELGTPEISNETPD